ncbi:branched-chain amino acid ABC transporter permease [Tumebacillus flagellatus]|uniref:Branched-chain amino acid ABC transporter permease n=1 Tax=Tumebacillus flagellatus TaxID=1157490 RepID=A0A074LKH5_9BACL|nr:branched-chain amino acid ABC transporter permease [Tumebacillus flagellatus]KEO82611.1 branched-chain amino acid ABC transporter permease [Tumebacillus flagellatus]
MRAKLFNNNLWLGFVLVALCLVPFVSSSKFLLTMLISVFLMAVYSMSYDLLLGYTGIVSFGHTIFFGLGAYSVGILLSKTKQPNLIWAAILIAVVGAAVIALIIGFLSLRVKDVYFSMITLAFAQLFFIISEKWSSFTGGGDGIAYVRVPTFFNDRVKFYFIALAFLAVMYLFLRRVVNSPFGRTLQAIRENEQRVESLGYNVLRYKLASLMISGCVAAMAGGLWTVLQKYVNTNVFAMDRTIDALLMTIVGGVGTLFGPIVGAGVITFAHEWLSSLSTQYPFLERWLLFFGILYIVIVMFFPKGILGTIRDKWRYKGGSRHAASDSKRRESVL